MKPPNVTFTDSMAIHKGGREVQLLFLGRGHTGGDTMVFLPAERIVFTGDFFEGRPGGGVLSYLGDSFIDEWPASLERLKAVDFDVIVPGHGAPLRERKQIDDFQNYLRDFWKQASALRAQGLTAAQATEKMDLSKFAPQYGQRVGRPMRGRCCGPTSCCRSSSRCRNAEAAEAAEKYSVHDLSVVRRLSMSSPTLVNDTERDLDDVFSAVSAASAFDDCVAGNHAIHEHLHRCGGADAHRVRERSRRPPTTW